jgi:excisionase family DNA binding protein
VAATDTTRNRRPLIDLPTVAEHLGVNDRHIRRLVNERRIPFVKWGRLLRFEPDEIDAWVEAARVQVER